MERVQPLSAAYLNSADPAKVRDDVASLGRQAKTKASSAAGAVSSKQQAAAAKGTQLVKQTGTGFKQSPFLPALGALAVAVAVAARRGGKAGSAPSLATPPVQDAAEPAPVPATDLDGLSRAEYVSAPKLRASSSIRACPRATSVTLWAPPDPPDCSMKT